MPSLPRAALAFADVEDNARSFDFYRQTEDIAGVPTRVLHVRAVFQPDNTQEGTERVPADMKFNDLPATVYTAGVPGGGITKAQFGAVLKNILVHLATTKGIV